ncbi:MAG TPA: NINE protein [Candidatus Acidoferrum sp.]|nr:NINE protein [Candidatus Acidoferrum sp.]
MYKIVGMDGRLYGPVGADEIRRWLAENRVNAQTLVQIEGAAEWKALGAIPEFASEARPAPPPVMSAVAAVTSRAANKIPAGVCGILLGSFGVHKFILGYTGAGLVMLLVTLIGGLLTCGVAAGVMHLIGLVEGIVYLCRPDEEFVRIYVDGRKEWF